MRTQASSKNGTEALSALNLVLDNLNVVLGLQCIPISIIGVGLSASCNNQAMCCQDTSHVRITPLLLPVLHLTRLSSISISRVPWPLTAFLFSSEHCDAFAVAACRGWSLEVDALVLPTTIACKDDYGVEFVCGPGIRRLGYLNE